MDTSYFSEIITITSIILIGIISPGPDFLLITRNSLLTNKKAAIFSALGLSTGTIIHALYSIIGLGLIISKSLILFSFIKYLGALYLFYIAFKSLRSHSQKDSSCQNIKSDMSCVSAFMMGFLTNVTNPKAILFYLSLFTLAIRPTAPLSVKMFYSLEVFFLAFVWFSLVAMFFSCNLITSRLQKLQNYTEKFISYAFLALGLKLIFTSTKSI